MVGVDDVAEVPSIQMRGASAALLPAQLDVDRSLMIVARRG
jgi:hypothetical protein